MKKTFTGTGQVRLRQPAVADPAVLQNQMDRETEAAGFGVLRRFDFSPEQFFAIDVPRSDSGVVPVYDRAAQKVHLIMMRALRGG